MKKEIERFKLVGMSKPNSATLETRGGEQFNAPWGMNDDRFEILFEYCKGNWNIAKCAVVACDGLNESGLPINASVMNIECWDKFVQL